MQIGDAVYITADRSKVYVRYHTIDTGFVNSMKVGSEYLVFSSEVIESANSNQAAVLRLQAGQYINAVFRYSSCDNIIYPVSGSTSYVPYAEVKENEFFAAEQAGLDAFLALKAEMLKLFPYCSINVEFVSGYERSTDKVFRRWRGIFGE